MLFYKDTATHNYLAGAQVLHGGDGRRWQERLRAATRLAGLVPTR